MVKFNIVKKAMTKNGHGEEQHRELMVGANQLCLVIMSSHF